MTSKRERPAAPRPRWRRATRVTRSTLMPGTSFMPARTVSPGIVPRWPSTSPTQPSRPRSSTARTPPRRRRPVGAVVRSVPHDRPDHREGRRRHRRRGGPREGQRRREPGHLAGVPGAVHPRGVRTEERRGRRRVRRGLSGARHRAVRGQPLADRGRTDRRLVDGRRHRGLVSGGVGARARQRGRHRRPRRDCWSLAARASRRCPSWLASPRPIARAGSLQRHASATNRRW